MSSPGTLSVVALQAMARISAWADMKASRSGAAATLWSVQPASRPLTTTGLSGPSSRTSFLLASILRPRSYQHAHWRFHKTLEGGKELRAKRAIDHAVVAGQRHAQQAGEGDAAVFLLDGLAARGPDGEYGRVRRIDDGGKLAHAAHAEIGNRGRSALIVGGRELLVPRTCDEVFHFGRNGAERLAFCVAQDRCDQPVVESNRDPDVGVFEAQDAVAGPDCIRRRQPLQGPRVGADEKVVERKFERWIAVCILWCGAIGLLAQRDQPPDVDVGGEMEVWNRLRLREARRDGAAHAVERHFLVAAGRIERLDVGGAGTFRPRGKRCGGWRIFNIARDDAAPRTRAVQAGKIDPALGGEPPRQRRDSDSAGKPRRTKIALWRAHFEERIEWHLLPLVPANAGTQRPRSLNSRLRGNERSRDFSARGFGGRGLSRRTNRRARSIRNHAHHGADRRHFAGRDPDFRKHATRRRRHLHRHLVGLDLEQIIARLHRLAGRLEPLGDLSLGNGFADLRHQDVHGGSVAVIIREGG